MINATDRCLIIEDNFVIFLDMEDMIMSAGFKLVDQAINLTQVREHLLHQTYSIALLDLRLNSGDSLAILQTLKKHEIPFAVTTSVPIENDMGSIFGEAPIVQKPYTTETVKRTVRELLSRQPKL
jgi:DNA-binding NtrC family response regulator